MALARTTMGNTNTTTLILNVDIRECWGCESVAGMDILRVRGGSPDDGSGKVVGPSMAAQKSAKRVRHE